MTDDYRLYLEEKFSGLNITLNRIEEKVNCMENKDKELYIKCPYKDEINKINKIDESLLEYKMIRKYPRVALYIFLMAIVVFTITIFI